MRISMRTYGGAHYTLGKFVLEIKGIENRMQVWNKE